MNDRKGEQGLGWVSTGKQGYRGLIVWRNAARLRAMVYELTRAFPQGEFRRVSQMRDAARSVKQNIQEGYIRRSLREYLQALGISRGSLAELIGDIEDCRQDGLLSEEQFHELDRLAGQTEFLLKRLVQALEQKTPKTRWLKKVATPIAMLFLPLLSPASPCFPVLTPVFAEVVALSDVAPLPAGTALFESEQRFADRGRAGGYAMKPSQYGVYYDDHVRREDSEGEAIFIRYRKAPSPSFCGAYVVILGDLSRYAAMTFWIKGAKGDETFELGLNDTISNKREDAVLSGSIHRYLPSGVTTEWQRVQVPLEDFFGADLERVYSLVFNFNEEGEGTFWIEGLSFHTEVLGSREDEMVAQGELLLDDFDHSDLNLLGRKANAYKRLPSVCRFSRVAGPRRGEKGRSLRLDFDKRATGWCGYYTLLNQIDGGYYDLSPYKKVTFWVKGGRGGESFEIGMADKSWLTIGDSVKAGTIEKYLASGVTTEWQEVVIPLADFGRLDWTQMGSFVINFHRPGSGAIFLEDLRLIRKTQEDLLKEWEEE